MQQFKEKKTNYFRSTSAVLPKFLILNQYNRDLKINKEDQLII